MKIISFCADITNTISVSTLRRIINNIFIKLYLVILRQGKGDNYSFQTFGSLQIYLSFCLGKYKIYKIIAVIGNFNDIFPSLLFLALDAVGIWTSAL